MLANALFKICMCKADFSFDPSSMSLVASRVFGDMYFYNRVGVEIFVVTAHGWYRWGWGGVLIRSMYARGTMSCYVDATFVHACTSTQCYVDVTFLHARYVVKSVVHMRI